MSLQTFGIISVAFHRIIILIQYIMLGIIGRGDCAIDAGSSCCGRSDNSYSSSYFSGALVVMAVVTALTAVLITLSNFVRCST